MKTEKSHSWKDIQPAHAAIVAGLPRSVLEAWNRRSGQIAQAAPLTAEEHIRMIELAAQRQAVRRRVTPESDLRDWLDAEEEVKSH
jgi:hypothetical protein